jgi:hypothetical protein
MTLPNAPIRKQSPVLAMAALVIAIFAVLHPIPSFIELYHIPADTACRPMGATWALFFDGMLLPVVAIILAVAAFFCGKASRRLAGVAVFLSLVPLPVYLLLLQWIIKAHHLHLES